MSILFIAVTGLMDGLPVAPACPCHITGNGLTETKDEEGRGHEIQREHIKLDADPEHQGNAKDPAEDYAKFLLSQKQSRRCQIWQAVYDQQGDT